MRRRPRRIDRGDESAIRAHGLALTAADSASRSSATPATSAARPQPTRIVTAASSAATTRTSGRDRHGAQFGEDVEVEWPG